MIAQTEPLLAHLSLEEGIPCHLRRRVAVTPMSIRTTCSSKPWS
jgi:hypothetical protein